MNAAQTALYFREWGNVRRWYLARGFDPKQADNKRHALHRQALGRDKSSKAFTNSDLDKVLAVFRAVYDGGNLDAQLRQLDQPENRRRIMVRRCEAAAQSFITGETDELFRHNLQAYLDGTADRMFGVAFVHLDAGQAGHAQLAKVMGALERTARVRKAKENPNPF